MNKPFGVICYDHPEIPHTEEVPFEDEAAMNAHLTESLSGGFDVNHVWAFVPTAEVAERLAAVAVNLTGLRPPMYKI